METVEQLDPAAYVGVDWASEEHAICVLGVDGVDRLPGRAHFRGLGRPG